ncbi:exodeoxyribonuclease V subunit beta [Litoribacillus peritrichatus]|uniref:RecBCD enzyme subunit RecB n=1 Tax=Litoribacillus peritrichatus TaxID=718191 RepID=A0ABP7MCH0_9GAMM
MTEPLNTLTFPLHGSRLIEASAGTGKTFTITGLYLRLLLGHGSDQGTGQGTGTAHEKPLTVDQILVVTFTEAATQELKDRIRLRIRAAREAFGLGSTTDPFINDLLRDISDHKTAFDMLRAAERQMDEAAIFTINGFCMRMLQQHAFESGNFFSVTMCEDDREIKLVAVKDYWRSFFYELSPALINVVLSCWKNPEALSLEIGKFLSEKPIRFIEEHSVDDLEAEHAVNLVRIGDFKSTLKEHFGALAEGITKAAENKQLDGRSYSKRHLPGWIASVRSWLEQPIENYYLPKELEHFGKIKLELKTKKPLNFDLDTAEVIQNFIDSPPELSTKLKQHAIRNARKIYAKHKRKHRLLTFDDQITGLVSALSDPQSGDAFAERLRTQFPVAMVDEFQDTDPSQYQIFERVYGGQAKQGLFMIGDPKQAIYAFRGGDIFTYMRARRAVSSHYTLDTNWRSSADMVRSVNAVFECSVNPFIYKNDIPFDPVKPNGNAVNMSWALEGSIQPAMTLWRPDEQNVFSKDSEYLDYMTQATANEIASLLTASDKGLLTLTKNAQEAQALKPSDIAVLVRNFNQANRIRAALSDRGIASVYSSDRSSVFEQDEARVVLRLLKGFQSPDNDKTLKSALGSHLFGLSALELERFNVDEHAWEKVVSKFQRYRLVWLQQGILPAFRQLIFDFDLAIKLRKQVNGERRLTDFLHLTELLQQQSKSLESQFALIRWLEERILTPNQNAKEQQLRLESEQNLVKVVTYHKSKGLEYDFVFAPYLAYYYPSNFSEISISHNEQGDAVVDVAGEAKDAAEKERLAEDIRLLYVVLTRSVYACFLGLPGLMAGTKKKPDPQICPKYVAATGLGYLLARTETDSNEIQLLPETVEDKVSRWCSASNIAVVAPKVADVVLYTSQKQVYADLEYASFSGDVESNWWVTSYSRLASAHVDYDASLEVKGYEDPKDSASDELLDGFQVHAFPKGAEAGTFLHTLFEELVYEECETEESYQLIFDLLQADNLGMELVNQALPKYVLSRMDEVQQAEAKQSVLASWTQVLHQMAMNVLSAPLNQRNGSNIAPVLRKTKASQRLVEMEFLIPITEPITCDQVNGIVEQDALSKNAQQGLSFGQVQGMLKGFIDLTFESEGKFYVLDWKSNYLGADSSFYTQGAMAEAMLDHRYDFQYLLYTLALHRYLRVRIKDYDYEEHIGGAYYVFLRGVEQDASRGVFFTKPDKSVIEQLDQLFAGIKTTECLNNAGGSETMDHGEVRDYGESKDSERVSQPEIKPMSDGQQGELF